MCEMRSGSLLTGGGKDRKIILWDHEMRAERDIEVLVWFGGSLFKFQEVSHHDPEEPEPSVFPCRFQNSTEASE